MRAKLLHLCPILHNHLDCSLPGSSIHGDPLGKQYWSGYRALQRIFLTQGSSSYLYVSCGGRWILYNLGSPVSSLPRLDH